jgi:hypothetical protein
VKIITAGLIIFVLVTSSIVLTPSTALQASSKGLKLYLTVDTNMYDQDITIFTNQYGYEIYNHDGYMYTGANEYSLNYPRHLVEDGPLEICVQASQGAKYAYCGDGYNSDAKQPEHVFVDVFVEEAPREISTDSQSQSQSQSNNQEQSNAQSQSNDQTVVIYNCPADSKCVIE